jgi:hypothetical protein
MMDNNNLENAIAVTHQIRDALRAEVERARAERVLIRAMDVEGLMKRAGARAEWNALVNQKQAQLSSELALVARAHGLAEVTIDGLRGVAPAPTERLAQAFAEVRSLAAALAELDDLNRALGQRALSFVRSYLTALSPRPAAYDRRGMAAATAVARSSNVMSRVV